MKVTDKRMFTPEGELREEYRFLNEKSTATTTTAEITEPAPEPARPEASRSEPGRPEPPRPPEPQRRAAGYPEPEEDSGLDFPGAPQGGCFQASYGCCSHCNYPAPGQFSFIEPPGCLGREGDNLPVHGMRLDLFHRNRLEGIQANMQGDVIQQNPFSA